MQSTDGSVKRQRKRKFIPFLAMPKLTLPKCILSDRWHTAAESRWIPRIREVLHEKDQLNGIKSYETYYRIGEMFRPRSILEIGVRFGYSLASLACGAQLCDNIFGVDCESYEPNSNMYAEAVLVRFGLRAKLYTDKSQQFDVVGRTGISQFDLIHIDGDHSKEGALHDLRFYSQWTKSLLVDDVRMPSVWAAIREFLTMQVNPVSCTLFRTSQGLALIEL